MIKWHDELRFKLVSLLNLHVRKFITETKKKVTSKCVAETKLCFLWYGALQ